MKTIKLIKHNTNIQFLKFKKATLTMSITICFFSIFSLFLNGLNFGIDFKGGTLIEVSSENNINISKLIEIAILTSIVKTVRFIKKNLSNLINYKFKFLCFTQRIYYKLKLYNLNNNFG